MPQRRAILTRRNPFIGEVIMIRHVSQLAVLLTLGMWTVPAWAQITRPTTSNHPWFSFAFFLWGSVFSLLLPTLGSVISYDLYTTREGKRVFALFGMGGILGGACGAFWTYLFGERLGSSRLIIQTLLMLVVFQLILLLIYHANLARFSVATGAGQRSQSKSPRERHSFWPRSTYLQGIAALVLVSAAASTLVDLQYMWFLNRSFTEEHDLLQFMAGLFALMYLISGIVQMSVTAPLLRRFGVQTAHR
jgi:AAA family ATP:ADP antiporter